MKLYNLSIIKKIILFFILMLIICIKDSYFIINEGERGLILKFGKIKKNINNNYIIYYPGLHFKIPYIEKIETFNSKIQTINSDLNNLINIKNKIIKINFYIKWKIYDYNLFYLKTNNNINKLEKLIENKLNNLINIEIEKLNKKNTKDNNKNILFKNIKYILNKNFIDKKQYRTNIIDNLYLFGIKIIDIRIDNVYLFKNTYNLICKKMIYNINKKILNDNNVQNNKLKNVKILTNQKNKNILYKLKKNIFIIECNTNLKINNILFQLLQKDIRFYKFIKILKIYINSFNKKIEF